MLNAAKITKASRKFAAGPAATTSERCHSGLFCNHRAATSGGTLLSATAGIDVALASPANITYPPSGSIDSFHRVPCLSVRPQISRPKPTENASACTPHQRPTR